MIRTKDIELDEYDSYGKKKLRFEVYRNLSDMEDGIQSKGPSMKMSDSDFFESARGDLDFNGFESPRELRELLRGGVKDTSAVRKVIRLRASKNTSNNVKKRVYDLMGEEVDVPSYLAGIPECMEDIVRARKPYRAIRLILDPTMHCGYSAKQMSDAGLVLARLVMALEKAGRSVHLSMYNAFVAHERQDIWFVSCDIKTAGTPLNAKKLLMCTSPAFFRGAGFTWAARTCPYRMRGLGTPLNILIQRHDMTLKFIKDNVYKDKELFLIRIKDVIDMLPRKSERTEGWEDRLVNQLFQEYLL